MIDIRIWGVLGLFLIGIGWLHQILEIIKSKHSHLNLTFTATYVLGSISLIIYSWELKDPIFIILKVIALLTGLIALFYSIRSIEIKKKVDIHIKKHVKKPQHLKKLFHRSC